MATDSAGNSGCQTYTLSIASASIIWVVNNTSDSGAGSLRDIVSLTQSGDTVEFASSLNGETITLTSDAININDSITITGPGASELTISGNNNSEIFSTASSTTVTISGLSLTNGNGVDHATNSFGAGAVDNFGILAVLNCNIFGNTTQASGGGIENQSGGTLTVSNCMITNNSAPDNAGGGIASFTGTVTITSSSISGNSAGLSGGGIANDSNPNNPSTGPGTLTVIDSTISNNTGLVGGINNPNGGTLTMKNSTISGNQATDTTHGGGIENGVGSTATITNCTISGNSTSGNGGGINNSASSTGVVNLWNTIVAGNTATSGGNDCDGKINSLGHNLVQSTTGVSGLVDTDQQGVNPTLGVLANNGGPTETLALLPGSPAIDGGDDSVLTDPVFTTDQRGTGFARKVFAHVDIGAFEQQVEITPTTITPAVEGSFYSQQFAASGNSPSFTLMLLGTAPPGLSFNSPTGILSGTPTEIGTFQFSIQAVGSDNPAKNVTNKYSLVVYNPPFVTLNPMSQTVIAGSTVSFTAAASGSPVITVQWQVSTNSGASFTDISGATSTTLTFVPTAADSGDLYRAVFTNSWGSAATTAATLTVYNICLKGTSPDDIFQFNSVTGQYRFIECSSGYTVTGTGSLSTVDNVVTVSGTASNCKVEASFNLGQLTGTATITLTSSGGVSQTIRIVDNTSMGKGCAC
jgi:hypothetical protein